nr:PREDICTED: DNA polymerase alpha subunit B [Bemisia tabaci]
MVSRESLEEHFNEMGIEVADPVLDKCIELCATYDVGAEEFVETWVSFSLTHSSGNTDKPTAESIAAMERSALAKKQDSTGTPKRKQMTVYNNANSSVNANDDAVLSLYNVTPKGRTCQKRINVTPTVVSDDISSHRSPGTFSPATYSLTAITPSGNFKERTNRNQVLCSYGKEMSSQKSADINLNIEPYGNVIPPNSKYMYRQLHDDADILLDTTTAIGSFIVKKYDLPDPKSITSVSEVDFISIGRIGCDGNGRLNESSIILEGCRWDMNGATMPLRIPLGVEYSLFPGQIVVVEGKNPSRNCLLATKIYSDASVNPSTEIPVFQSKDPLQIIVASGPFTFNDSMLYEPLEDLLLSVEKLEPHIFILIGPLVDADHPLFGDNVSFLATPFQEYHEQIVKKLLDRFRGKRTKIVMVSSMRDACSHPVYPTPPTLSSHSIQSVSDPCLLNISGLIVGATSTDILMHLSKEEISGHSKTDRMTRLVSHLFAQQNFYPLFPSSEEVNLDLSLWEDFAQMTVIPNILLLPSKLRYFVKEINGCIVINPEYLAKGSAGGSFARIAVDSPSNNCWSSVKNISVQIIKV